MRGPPGFTSERYRQPPLGIAGPTFERRVGAAGRYSRWRGSEFEAGRFVCECWWWWGERDVGRVGEREFDVPPVGGLAARGGVFGSELVGVESPAFAVALDATGYDGPLVVGERLAGLAEQVYEMGGPV